MKRKLTVNDLSNLGACAPALRRFKRLFPNGVYMTPASYQKAEDAGLDVSWLVSMALTGAKWRKHDNRTDKLWKKYWDDKISIEEYHQKNVEECVRALKEDWSPEPKNPNR